MLSPVGVLPLQLACQLLISENHTALINVRLNTPSPKLATDFPSGYIVLPDKEVAYKYFNHKVTWNVARNYCASEGGYLAVIDTYEKLQFTMDMNKSGSHLHAGFHKLFGDAEWYDVKTGLPGAIPWRGDPLHGDNRLCAAVLDDRSGIVAITCAEQYAFVCEISVFKD